VNVVFVLVRKHLVEAKWMLGLSAAAFFALSLLTAWMARGFERLIESGELGPDVRRFGFLRALGGSNQDYSTTALEVCWWNHPVIVMTVLAWAVSRGSASVAGEIERGTIDVTLSRPVSRLAYLGSHVLFALLGLLALAAALVCGSLFGSAIYTLKAPPSLLTLLRPATMVVTLGLAVFGYTLPFSTMDVVRWRPTLASSALTLGGLLGMSLAPQYPDYRTVLDNLSVFQVYAPVTVALKGQPLAFNATVLLTVFAVGVAVSVAIFSQRDLPSNS
jgi:ABC-2 type transport system permease protein